MQRVMVEEVKNQLTNLTHAAVNGDEVVICDNGSAVKLVPEQQQKPARRKAVIAKGIISRFIHGD